LRLFVFSVGRWCWRPFLLPLVLRAAFDYTARRGPFATARRSVCWRWLSRGARLLAVAFPVFPLSPFRLLRPPHFCRFVACSRSTVLNGQLCGLRFRRWPARSPRCNRSAFGGCVWVWYRLPAPGAFAPLPKADLARWLPRACLGPRGSPSALPPLPLHRLSRWSRLRAFFRTPVTRLPPVLRHWRSVIRALGAPRLPRAPTRDLPAGALVAARGSQPSDGALAAHSFLFWRPTPVLLATGLAGSRFVWSMLNTPRAFAVSRAAQRSLGLVGCSSPALGLAVLTTSHLLWRLFQHGTLRWRLCVWRARGPGECPTFFSGHRAPAPLPASVVMCLPPFARRGRLVCLQRAPRVRPAAVDCASAALRCFSGCDRLVSGSRLGRAGCAGRWACPVGSRRVFSESGSTLGAFLGGSGCENQTPGRPVLVALVRSGTHPPPVVTMTLT